MPNWIRKESLEKGACSTSSALVQQSVSIPTLGGTRLPGKGGKKIRGGEVPGFDQLHDEKTEKEKEERRWFPLPRGDVSCQKKGRDQPASMTP